MSKVKAFVERDVFILGQTKLTMLKLAGCHTSFEDCYFSTLRLSTNSNAHLKATQEGFP